MAKKRIADEKAWMLQQLSTNALTLAGFSFTSLAFMIGLLHNSTPPSMRTGLLVCTITFAISGEIARTCSRVIEYLASEIIYFASLVILFSVFIAFAFETLDVSSIVAAVAAGAGLVYIFWRAYLDLKQLGN